jgi:hypothetical protein
VPAADSSTAPRIESITSPPAAAIFAPVNNGRMIIELIIMTTPATDISPLPKWLYIRIMTNSVDQNGSVARINDQVVTGLANDDTVLFEGRASQ